MKLKRYLSFALAAIMTLSMSLIPVSAQSEIQYTSADLPEMLSYNDAVSAGHVNRLTAEEELNTLVFANSDNTKTMYYFSENIKYVDESGDICYKTNDLTYSSGAYINAENDINVSLPLTLSSGVTLAYEDILISMTPNVTGSSSVSDSISASAVFNSASNNQSDSVSYQSVFGVGTAVRYTPLYSGIKEDIILSSYTGVYSFNFLIETNGLLILPESTISDDDSMISGNASELSEPTRWYFAYEDDTDTPVALISDIYIYDSIGAETKGSVSITPYIDDNYILTVTADRAFLESSSTVYPVTIDPTITINYNNSTIHDSSISSYLVTSNFGSDSYLNVGGSYNYYSALKFQGLTNNSVFSSLSAGQIYSSTLNMYCYSKSGTNMSVTVSQYSPNSITSGYWTEGTITYSKCGVEVNEVDEVNAVTKTITSAVPYSFDITAIVKKWKSTSNLIEQGLLISPSDSSSSAMAVFASSEYSTASLRPYLTINYREFAYFCQNNPSLSSVSFSIKNLDILFYKTDSGISEKSWLEKINTAGCVICSIAMILRNLEATTTSAKYDIRTATSNILQADPFTVTLANTSFPSITYSSTEDIYIADTTQNPVLAYYNRIASAFGRSATIYDLTGTDEDKANDIAYYLSLNPEGIAVSFKNSNNQTHTIVFTDTTYEISTTYTVRSLNSRNNYGENELIESSIITTSEAIFNWQNTNVSSKTSTYGALFTVSDPVSTNNYSGNQVLFKDSYTASDYEFGDAYKLIIIN